MNTDATSPASVQDRVIAIAAAQAGVDPATVTPATGFFSGGLSYDSLDVAEFVMEIEDAFEVGLPDEQADKFQTVQDVVDRLTNP